MANSKDLTRLAKRVLSDPGRTAEEAQRRAAALEEEGAVLEAAGSEGGAAATRVPVAPERLPDYLRAGAKALEKVEDGQEDLTADEQLGLEAIVLLFGRPALLVQDGDFAAPPSEWQAKLNPKREVLKDVIARVGRIELSGHPSFPWVGTGFLVGPDVIMTNRHVAVVFAQESGGGYAFMPGVSASLDYKEEYQRSDSNEFRLRGVIGVHPSYDLALLRVETTGVKNQPPPTPLVVASASPAATRDFDVAVVGYPAYDSRNDAAEMLRIFEGIFNVKRLQPGSLTGMITRPGGDIVGHDCSSLGGNSGSAVVDIASGQVLALHFGGRYLVGNYAVPLWGLEGDPLVGPHVNWA